MGEDIHKENWFTRWRKSDQNIATVRNTRFHLIRSIQVDTCEQEIQTSENQLCVVVVQSSMRWCCVDTITNWESILFVRRCKEEEETGNWRQKTLFHWIELRSENEIEPLQICLSVKLLRMIYGMFNFIVNELKLLATGVCERILCVCSNSAMFVAAVQPNACSSEREIFVFFCVSCNAFAVGNAFFWIDFFPVHFSKAIKLSKSVCIYFDITIVLWLYS